MSNEMRNVAKINLEVNRCLDCPFCCKPDGYSEYYCRHDLKHPGIEIGDGEMIPDFCPFVIERLKNVIAAIEGGSSVSIPKKFLFEIEKKQRDDPCPKFGADHSWLHMRNVTKIGESILEQCVHFGYVSPNSIQKEKLLFQIAAYMHDIGLADSAKNHAIHSAELAKKFLAESKKIDMDVEDITTVVKAIRGHSNLGESLNKEARLTEAILILADKLDVTQRRIVRVTDSVTAAVSHIIDVKYELYGKNGKAKGAKLKYYTDGNFDTAMFKAWPKCVLIPRAVTNKYFGLPEFVFLIDDIEICVDSVVN